MREIDLLQKARKELLRLGYKSSDIYLEYSIQDHYIADLVVLSEEKPFLVIEVTSFDYSVDIISDYLKFDPVVKQVQSYANVLKAPFFAVFNGRFLWFSTDQSGRPELKKDPVIPAVSSSSNKLSRSSVISSLQQLRSYMIHNLGYWSIEHVGLFLYAQLLDEQKIKNVKQELINGKFEDYNLNLPINSHHPWKKEVLKEIFFIIERIQFIEADKDDFLLAVDEVFNQPRQSLFVPRWICDLMIKISNINEHDRAIDLSATHGNIITALLFNFPQFPFNNIVGTYAINQSEYWLKFQERLISDKELKHHRINISDIDLIQFDTQEKFDKILIAPIFGGKFYNNSELSGRIITDNLEFSLEKALQISSQEATITFLAPETFLFSEKFKRLRQTLQKAGQIATMISLPIGAFQPYSSVKTSLVVFKKGKWLTRSFIAKIESSPKKDTFNCRDLTQINDILSNYFNKAPIPHQDISQFYIDTNQINFKNLSNIYYFKAPATKNIDTYESYPLIQVTKIIKKGFTIKRDENGKIPFISPKSVREFKIDEKSLGLTSESSIPTDAIRTQTDDVLINAISTYKGEAALVRKENSGFVFSQHVILIRPNKDIILPEYLAILLNSKFLKMQFEQISSGAVISFIPLSLIKDISIPVPPMNIQQGIIERVKNVQESIKANEDTLKKSKEELEKLLDKLNIGEEGL